MCTDCKSPKRKKGEISFCLWNDSEIKALIEQSAFFWGLKTPKPTSTEMDQNAKEIETGSSAWSEYRCCYQDDHLHSILESLGNHECCVFMSYLMEVSLHWTTLMHHFLWISVWLPRLADFGWHKSSVMSSPVIIKTWMLKSRIVSKT